MKVTAAYAKANLPELLKAVERGERVTISRYRKPNWDKAIETQEALEAFLRGDLWCLTSARRWYSRAP